MSDPWKDAWDHLKKYLTDRVEARYRWGAATKDLEGIRDWMCDKEREMIEDGLIEGSEADAKEL